jgi:ketosteroid isomerase-like protein
MSAKSLLVSLLFGVMGVLGGCAQAPLAAPGSAADVARLCDESLIWFEHYGRADGEAMAALYAQDALLMPPGAPAVQGRAAIREFLGRDAAATRAAGFALKNDVVTGTGLHGDCGWISGRYLVVDASGATVDGGSYLSVHQRVGGTWLYVRDIWNSDRPAH